MRAYQSPVLFSTARDDFTVSVPQAGKTFTAAEWLLAATWMAGNLPWAWWWAAPTYDLTYAGYMLYCEMADSAGILADRTTRPPLTAKLINGARVEGRSWHKADNLRGHPVAGAVVDEFGMLTWEAYKNLSARRLETINHGLGFYRYLGNVGEIGGAGEELWNRAEAGSRGMACRRWTWRDRALDLGCACDARGINPELGTSDQHDAKCSRRGYVAFVENEAERLSRREFDQVYEAEWGDANDLPVYDFNRDTHVTSQAEHSDKLALEVCCDFNVDPMAWVIGHHHGMDAWDFDEIIIPGGARTEQACRELIRRYPSQRQPVRVYGDASGKHRDTRSNVSDYDQIRQLLGAHYHNLEILIPTSNPPVAERVNAVNAAMAPKAGEPRYGIHPRCVHTIRSWARTSYLPGTRDIDKRPDRKTGSPNLPRTHPSDASGYRIHWLWPTSAKTVVEVGVPVGGMLETANDEILGASF